MNKAPGRQSALLLLSLVDTAVALGSLYAASLIRANVLTRWPSLWSGEVPLLPTYTVLLVGSLPIIVCSLYVTGAYSWPRLTSRLQTLASIAKASGLATLMVLASAYALRDMTYSRSIVVSYLAITFTTALLIRLVFCRWFLRRMFRGRGLQNAVIVGTGPAARAIAQTMQRKPYLGYRVTGFVRMEDERYDDPSVETICSVDDLPRIADDAVVDTVVFGVSLEEAARCERIIWKLEEVGKTVHLRGDAIGVMLSRTFIGEFDGMPMLTLESTPGDPIALAIKRAIDAVGAGLGLLALTPVLAFAALAVRLSSPGPVFYRQRRVGLNGRIFTIYKFRSMFIDAEKRQAELRQHNEMSGPVFKMANDPRITPVGRWLRKYSIDELPQLWNVFIGEMSLVGPRPPIPSEVQCYERWQRRRLSMKSGITCLWQTGGRNEVDFDTWMKLDMEYIDNWSLALDMKILLKTIPVVLLAKGAR